MSKPQELCRNAEAAFGDEFDIRAFHDRVLEVSSWPLPMIEADIRAWIADASSGQ